MNGKHSASKISAVFALVAFILAGCGGGGGSSTGTGSAGVVQGTITGFGSVIVNGIRFHTGSTNFQIEGDDNPSQSDLDEGMVVTVEGTIDPGGTTGTATRLVFQNELEGPINAIDPAMGTVDVMGSSVVVDGNTMFQGVTPPDLTGLAVGNVIEVSGFPGGTGLLQATHIQLKAVDVTTHLAAGNTLEVRGELLNLNTLAGTFTIGSLVVNYLDFPADISDMVGGLTGMVEVKSTVGFNGSSELVATKVEPDNGALGAAQGVKVEVEGLIASFVSAASFEINGQPVDASNATYFNGAEEDLANNVRVEAEGLIQGGILVASKLKFKGNRIRITAFVDTGGVSTANSTVTLMGLPFQVNGLTEVEDQSGAGADLSDVANINDGDPLEIRAYQSGGVFVATELRRLASLDADKSILKGPANTIADPTFKILTVNVDTAGLADAFFLQEDVEIGRASFFSTLADNIRVKAKGTYASGTGTITATEVEIDLE